MSSLRSFHPKVVSLKTGCECMSLLKLQGSNQREDLARP